jgi:uncharacterized membrane protein
MSYDHLRCRRSGSCASSAHYRSPSIMCRQVRQARRARSPAHRRQHRQAAGAAAELEVMTGIPWKLSQISEKARVKHDRIGAESRRLLRRGHLYEHLGHAAPAASS